MSQIVQKKQKEGSAISNQTIRQVLTGEEKAQKALSRLEGELKTLRLGLKFTTNQVAELLSKNPRIMKNISASLLNNFFFRKRISEEILAYLLEKEEKAVQ